jgi:hypothetical protein
MGMEWLARLFARAQAPEGGPGVQPHATDDSSSASVEELSVLLREARGKARAARQRGRVMQRDGRMSEALRAFKVAGDHQAKADRLERERALIRRAG